MQNLGNNLRLIPLIHIELLNWYKENKRVFPWRKFSNPYKITIAEFMLHRTKAEQVAPIYKKFIKKFDDFSSLATANIEQIQEFTNHLGLHWRADHFIKSALYITHELKNKFPSTRKELLLIPGIGDYAAGVILTVCYKKNVHVVDSNIARFINRFFNLHLSGEIRRKKVITEISTSLFEVNNPHIFLFALLDFTALICKALNPVCSVCTLRDYCQLFN